MLTAVCHSVSAGPRVPETDCKNTTEDHGVYATHCGIPNTCNMDSGIAFQLGPSEVAVHCNLPVTLGVRPDVVHRCDILHAYSQGYRRSSHQKGFLAESVIMCKAAAPNIAAELQ